MPYVDLHLHSRASDGVLAPAELVRRSAAADLAGISLTDHDTAAGLPEAAAACARAGLRFLPGAELSANEPGKSVHLLAYGFDPEDAGMQAFFEAFRRNRRHRAERIVERLRAVDVLLDPESVWREAGEGVPTRAHVARALLREGWIDRIEEAFDRWLSAGGPAYVEKRESPPGEVFRLVREAGGVTLLAHPGRSFSEADIHRWIEMGLDGVEVRHPSNPPDVRARLEAMAEGHDLLRGGGSDWHGPDSGGAPPGSQRVPLEWMEAIEARCAGRSTG